MRDKVLRYFFMMMLVSTACLSVLVGLMVYYSSELPPISEIKYIDMKVGSEVYDRNDQLIHVFAFEHRKLTHIQNLPPYLIKGLIATEDQNFYHHWGIDLFATFKAMLVDVVRVDFALGASTITQQLARNMFLTLDKTLPRKIKEVMLAVRIEQIYSKEEILEMYLNKIPIGPGIYGVERASWVYFGKEAKDLAIPEAALLVGNIQLPSGYYPFRNPERAMKRRNYVLKRMRSEHAITKAEFKLAVKTPLGLKRGSGFEAADDYFIDYIRQILEEKYGTNAVFSEGLKIYTTLDHDLQIRADSLLNQHLTAFEKQCNYKYKYGDFPPDTVNIKTPYIQGGVLVEEAQTGYILAMIGGRNFQHSKFNHITLARRQPGSSFKPIVYTTALEHGYTPATVMKDEPILFRENGETVWEPKNYSHDYKGYMRMRDALKESRNIYSIKIVADLGPEKVVSKAKEFGLTTKIQPYYSLAVGATEVLPLELISAYTAFPNGGERSLPMIIRRVENSQGKVLEENHPRKSRVMDEKVAYLMTSLMETVVDHGTGYGVRARGYRGPAAGKTGTTDDNRDAWFIGFNPQVVCGIWVGFDDNHTMGGGRDGSVAALPVWPGIVGEANACQRIAHGPSHIQRGYASIDNATAFHRPDGIVSVPVSKRTGLLPSTRYEGTVDELFIAGTEPTVFSDSLDYNFYPSRFKSNSKRYVVFDIGRNRVGEPRSSKPAEPDSLRPGEGKVIRID
jgi:1A family penicillin-binding protein